jgi:hypothetical protein
MRRLGLLLTVDGCGYGDGARAAGVDVAKSVRERLDSISPVAHIRTQRRNDERTSGART